MSKGYDMAALNISLSFASTVQVLEYLMKIYLEISILLSMDLSSAKAKGICKINTTRTRDEIIICSLNNLCIYVIEESLTYNTFLDI